MAKRPFVNRLNNLASIDTSYITTPEAIEEVQTKLAKKQLRELTILWTSVPVL